MHPHGEMVLTPAKQAYNNTTTTRLKPESETKTLTMRKQKCQGRLWPAGLCREKPAPPVRPTPVRKALQARKGESLLLGYLL